jgi:hypothetical protein
VARAPPQGMATADFLFSTILAARSALLLATGKRAKLPLLRRDHPTRCGYWGFVIRDHLPHQFS